MKKELIFSHKYCCN